MEARAPVGQEGGSTITMYLRVAGCCVAYFEQIPAQGAAVGARAVNLANAPATYARTWAQNHVAAGDLPVARQRDHGLLATLRTTGIIDT
ncbi:hypothetical protein [Nonomuraea sp. NPDC049709]|uniref:hypothetical protein n=1 Tax=Nonomuraea sp. NPDC049709 TaxID=3154736 RepID=UPI003443A289